MCSTPNKPTLLNLKVMFKVEEVCVCFDILINAHAQLYIIRNILFTALDKIYYP